MINSKKFADAIVKDYQTFKAEIENSKSFDYKNSNLYWSKILTNIMHAGSNKRTLLKRMQTPEFIEASDFKFFKAKSNSEKNILLKKFVPGGRYIPKDKKIKILINAMEYIESNGIENLFNAYLDKNILLYKLMKIDGIGSKMARNISMDLYHPSFRNGSIPIDNNWKNIGRKLGFNWTESARHEKEIIDWKEKYIGKDIIEEDWEFDRLIYTALTDNNSEINRLLSIARDSSS